MPLPEIDSWGLTADSSISGSVTANLLLRIINAVNLDLP